MKPLDYTSPPPLAPRREGLRPVGGALNAIVQNLRAPLPKVAPRKLEKAR